MAAVTRRRALGLFGAATVLPVLTACLPAAADEEEDDCDADDLLEGDDDCYGSSHRKKPKPAKTKSKTGTRRR